MTTTTFDGSATERSLRSISRLAVTVLFAIVLCVAAFAIGRVSAPTHAVRSVITAPTPASLAPLEPVTSAAKPAWARLRADRSHSVSPRR